jgi:hypothetical protein
MMASFFKKSVGSDPFDGYFYACYPADPANKFSAMSVIKITRYSTGYRCVEQSGRRVATKKGWVACTKREFTLALTEALQVISRNAALHLDCGKVLERETQQNTEISA